MPNPTRFLARAQAVAWLAALFALPMTAVATPPIPMAVLGDSDSHGYQDTVSFPPGSPDRGGPFRATTYQWTEVLATLRGDQVDLGPRATTGTRGAFARLLRAAGVDARSPRKRDHLHNLAVSGQGCADLDGGPSNQVQALLRLLAADPARWHHGVVVIRIGVNTFGKSGELDRLADDPGDRQVAALIDDCTARIRAAVDTLAAAQPGTRFVTVGIFDNSHWASYAGRWASATAQANIARGLDRFDDALRQLATDRRQVAFFDDRAWFQDRWGGRDADGRAAYRPVPFGPLRVTNTLGDAPQHATLADGHAGTAWNALWAQSLVAVLNSRFGLGLAPLRDDELVTLLSRPQVP